MTMTPPAHRPGQQRILSDVAAIDESHLEKFGYSRSANRD